MVAYLKVGPQVRTYSDYLRATRKAKKDDLIELSQSSSIQAADSPSKLRTTRFFPLRKCKGNQPLSKKATICLAHLEEEDADDGKDPGSDDPGGIKGMTEEFMVWLARAVKDAQEEEKHSYHCSSPEHFICNCLLMKANNHEHHEEPRDGGSWGIKTTSQTPFLNLDPFQWWYRIKNIAKVKINGESCMALLDNSVQVNTIMLRYMRQSFTASGTNYWPHGFQITCVGLGNAYTGLLG